MLQYHASAGPAVGISTTRRIGRPACDVSRLRFDSSGLLVVPLSGIADGPAWRHLSDLRVGALQTRLATVIPIQIELDHTALARGGASVCNRNWRRIDDDRMYDDAPSAPSAVPFSLVRYADGFAAASASTRNGITLARRHAGAPAVTTRPETVASAGRRAGGREPAGTQHESPAVQ